MVCLCCQLSRGQFGNSVFDARNYGGSDWCAQVNAANSTAGSNAAVLLVPSQISGMPGCSSQIILSSNHVLQFGPGTFNLGTLNGRPGILIDHAINNVGIVGAGIGITTLIFSSFNTGATNIFPWGSAVGIGTVNGASCSIPLDPANHISIFGITFSDQQTGSSMSSSHNPSIIDGACVNDITIEHNEFTNAKGNGAITITGKWNTQGGNNYRNQNNKYDGTATGNWGEFAADNSGNFTNVWWSGNSVSGYKCSAFGMNGIFRATVSDNIIDQTQVAGTCAAIGIGANANIGYVGISNNTIIMNDANAGPCIQTTLGGSSADAEIDIEHNRCITQSGVNTQGIALGGVASGNAPTQIVRGNFINATYPILVTGPTIGTVEVSDSVIEGAGNNQDIFGCAGETAIISGSTIRIYSNKANAGIQAAHQCTDPSFATPAFIQKDNVSGTRPI